MIEPGRETVAGAEARRTRVAFVSDALPDRNGVGTYYRDLIEQLEGSTVHAELVCPDDPRRELISLPLPGDATQRLSVPSPRSLARRLAELDPATIVVATPGPYGLLGARYGRRKRAHVIIGFHTHFEKLTELYWRSLMRRLSRRYLESANRHLFRHGAVVLANSGEMMSIASRLGARDVRLMGTLLAKPFLEAPATPPRPRLERALFAGRLALEKNLEAVVEAAEQVPEVRFSIAGDGPLRARMESAAARLPNLELLGWVPRRRLVEEMDEHDLLVLPSKVESFGTVGIEAMARQRLVLVSDQCGMVQWPSLSGSLYQVGAEESLGDAVRRVAELPESERRRTAARGRTAAIELNERSLGHWLKLLDGDQDRQSIRA